MAAANLTVGVREYHDEDKIVSMILSGVSTSADASAAVGYAVELDTSATGTVKLATDGGKIYGRVEQANYRAQEGVTIASIALSFQGEVPYLSTATVPVVGSQVVGAGAGKVKAMPAVTIDPTATAAITLANPGSTWPHIVLANDTTNYFTTLRFNF